MRRTQRWIAAYAAVGSSVAPAAFGQVTEFSESFENSVLFISPVVGFTPIELPKFDRDPFNSGTPTRTLTRLSLRIEHTGGGVSVLDNDSPYPCNPKTLELEGSYSRRSRLTTF